jgi:lipopolysaccharide heptosyltransferase II
MPLPCLDFPKELNMAQESWETAQRLLCIRLDSLGDVLMTTPALRALKQAQPGRHITLLTSPSGAAVAGMLPYVDECLVYESPWMKHTPLRAVPSADLEMIELLRKQQFDAAVIFTVFSQNPLPAALLCYLAGVPRRLAYCRENPYQLLTTWLRETEPQEQLRHEVRRQLDLVAAIGCRPTDERMSLSVPRQTVGKVRSLLAERGISKLRPWLVVHPGATAASRRYPPEMFSVVIRELMERHYFQVVITGGTDELDLVEAIQSRLRRPAIALAGQLDLPDLAAVLSLAPVLLSNNTGPVHLAAAVGTPVVDLYALTNPQHTPWMVPSRVLNHDVPCKYCFKSICPEGHHDCLRLVEPATVAAAVVDLYQQQRGARGATEKLPPLQTCP